MNDKGKKALNEVYINIITRIVQLYLKITLYALYQHVNTARRMPRESPEGL